MVRAKRIHKLSPALVHKIAAGEVIEAPHSVVKELVENSLDAGARQIRVESRGGLAGVLEVTDDGHGILAEDIPLAVREHATSKIGGAADLTRIDSYGFRGEALASMASVSELALISRVEGEENGWEYLFRGGDEISHRPVAMKPGTSIRISELFFNTPVRRKFLGSERKENRQIRQAVTRLALAQPGVGFTLLQNDRSILELAARKDASRRVSDVFGPDYLERFFPLERENGPFRLSGWVSVPGFYRAHRREQYFFINGRPVEIAGAGRILKGVYGDLLAAGQYPTGFFYFNINPSRIDCNVHPTKKEIRFLDEEEFYGFFRAALRDSLRGDRAWSVGEIRSQTRRRRTGSGEPRFRDGRYWQGRDRQNLMDFGEVPANRSRPLSAGPGDFQGYAGFVRDMAGENPLDQGAEAEAGVGPDPEAEWESVSESHGESSSRETVGPPPGAGEKEVSEGEEKGEFRPRLPLRRHLGLIMDTYILAEDDRDLLLIDQHVAHERVLYEQARGQIESDELEKQPLLTPVLEKLTPAEAELVREIQETLAEMGLVVDFMGPTEVVIREIPFFVPPTGAPAIFRDLLHRLGARLESSKKKKSGPAPSLNEYAHDFAASVACQAAVKKGDRLSDSQLGQLLRDLSHCEDPWHCPHGRPVVLRLSRREIDQLFHRES